MSPTQRTIAALKKRGLIVGTVERWLPRVNVRKDLFGFIDLIAMDPDGGRIIGVQSTGQDFSGHREKLTVAARKQCTQWIRSGGLIELWGWRKLKVKRGGKAVRYVPQTLEITIEGLWVDRSVLGNPGYHARGLTQTD
jgi:hypothetical protein